MASFTSFALFALSTGLSSIVNAQGTSGTTTRYWDCCKPSCSWSGKADVGSPVKSCSSAGNPLDANVGSACDKGNPGDAHMCTDQQPWSVSNTLAYGFAAANLGSGEAGTCCGCYELTFTSTSLQASKKQMIVQVTNSGSDLTVGQFDLAMPGGGVGLFDACSNHDGIKGQWGGSPSDYGAQYGGLSSGSQCSKIPAGWQPGCGFRFGWFEGADNPTVSYRKVSCPAVLSAKTGCTRKDDASAPAAAAAADASADAPVEPKSPADTGAASSEPVAAGTTEAATSVQTATGITSAAAATLPADTEPPVTTTTTAVPAAPETTLATTASSSRDVEPTPSGYASQGTVEPTGVPASDSPVKECPAQYVTQYDL